MTDSADPAGSALAAQRRKVPHTCLICGRAFVGLKTAIYCPNTHACRQKAKYLKKKMLAAGKRKAP